MGVVQQIDPVRNAPIWAIARVESVAPREPTWSRPATLVLAVEKVLRGGELPSRVTVRLGPPHASGQSYFYIVRFLGPAPWAPDVQESVARQRAALDATAIAVPDVGARIAIGLTPLGPDAYDVVSSGEQWIPEGRIAGMGKELAPPPPYRDERAIRARWGLAGLIAGVLAATAFFVLGMHRGHPALWSVFAVALAAMVLGALRIVRSAR